MDDKSGLFEERTARHSAEEWASAEYLVRYLWNKLRGQSTTCRIFIATGTTAWKVGVLLVKETPEELRRQIRIFTHSLPFAHSCLELYASGLRIEPLKVEMLGGSGHEEEYIDFVTGLVGHPRKLPRSVYFDYFVWGTHSVSVRGVHSRRDSDYLRAITVVSKNIMLLPSAHKFQPHEFDKPLRYWATLKRTPQQTWHLILPVFEKGGAKSNEIDRVAAAVGNAVTIHYLSSQGSLLT